MESFEQYLKRNRDQLKTEVTSKPEIWDMIESNLSSNKPNRLKWISPIAASLALLLATTALLITLNKQKVEMVELPLTAYSAAYGDTEQEYIGAINFKKQQVDQMNVSVAHQKEIASFLNGLKALEMAYDGYKVIVDQEGCSEIMMQLIIDNYQRRIDLLEELQNELIKLNSNEIHTKQNEATISI